MDRQDLNRVRAETNRALIFLLLLAALLWLWLLTIANDCSSSVVPL